MADKLPISISIVAYNEEVNIRACLDSVIERAEQVVVLDANSTDQTGEIIQKEYPQVDLIHHSNELNINVNKMRAMAKTKEPWVFYLDADERFTPALWEEIAQAIKTKEYNGYRVGRQNFYFGKWLKHGGQYPDRQPRLFRQGKGKFAMQHIHEFLEIEGKTGDLKETFIHLTYRSIAQYFGKFEHNANYQAKKWYDEGVRWNLKNHLKFGFLRPIGRFLQKYIYMGGFLDGFLGFTIAYFQGIYELNAYLRIKDQLPDADTSHSNIY
jgi:glycosyltransferase involved in cell wall biosynthesis